MNKINIYSFSALTLLFSGVVMAQEKDKKENNIGTEVVDVVRPYEATISDAFKISDMPKLDDKYNTQKKIIKYSINSFPVASTFIPERGKAKGVENEPKLFNYNNYALLEVGNYANLNGELFLSYKVNDTDMLSGKFRRESSKGGIDNLLLNDYFSKTSVDVFYGQNKEDFNWNLNLGGKYRLFNWYGLPMRDFYFSSFDANDIDEEQIYRTLHLGGRIEFNKSDISFIEAKYKTFLDDFQSKENRFFLKTKVSTSIKEQDFDVDFKMDYVGTDYDEMHNTEKISNQTKNSYKHFNFGFEPSIYFQDDWYILKLGAGLFVNSSVVNGDSRTFPYIYPKITASFNLVEDILLSYVGAEGGLKQNSYADFIEKNPFVSPVNMILPTNELFDIYAGLKGKFDYNISYNIKGFYKREMEKAFFKTRSLKGMSGYLGYEYGNSFDVVYSNLNTLGLYGELRFDYEKYVSIGLSGELNKYITDLEEAWNMPVSKLSADVRVYFSKDFYASSEVYLVGERKDLASDNSLLSILGAELPIKTLDPYVDFNLEVGYRPTDKWTVFLRGKNLLNKNYQKWNNYKVQGAQIMAGAIYKFDFK